jgi:hypothetical protein
LASVVCCDRIVPTTAPIGSPSLASGWSMP